MSASTLAAGDMIAQLRAMLRAHATLLLSAVADAVVGQAAPLPPVRRSVRVPERLDAETSPAARARYVRKRADNLIAIATYRADMHRYVRALRRFERDRQFATQWFGNYPERLAAAWNTHGGTITAATAVYERHRQLYGTRDVSATLPKDPAAPDYIPAHDWVERQAMRVAPVALDVPERSAPAAFVVPTVREVLAQATCDVEAETLLLREALIDIKADQLLTRYVRLARATFPRAVLAQAEQVFEPVGTWLLRQWAKGAGQKDLAAAYCYAVYCDTLLEAEQQGVGNVAMTLSAMINDFPLARTGEPASKREAYEQYLEHKDFRHAEGDRRSDRPTDLNAMYIDPDGEEGRPTGIVHTSMIGLDGETCHVCYAQVEDHITHPVDISTGFGRFLYAKLGGRDWTRQHGDTGMRGWAAIATKCDCTVDFVAPVLYVTEADAVAALRAAVRPRPPVPA